MHVLLVNEGTYPFHWGGVSTWCHLLIRDMPDVDFTLFSLVADPRYKLQFSLPKNVVDFQAIPLWGIYEALETRTDLTLPALLQRRRQTTATIIANEFVPIFRAFLCELYTSDINPEYLGRLIQQMYQFFQTNDFDTTMRSQECWVCFADAVQEYFPETAARHGYANAAFELWDVTQGLQWLYHWLFPLAYPLPQTDIVHASTVGICTMVAVVAKLEYGAAYMLSEHGIYLRERYLAESASANSLFLKMLSLRFARRMSHLSYAMADQISPCCDYNQRWEYRNGASPDRIRTIYYGVDSGQFVPGGKVVGEPPVVVWVGRINPLKDVITLINAAARVKSVRPDIQFKLFGSAAPEDQAYYTECLDLYTKLDLADTVTFAGYSSNAAEAYNQGDIVVLCSISEGFPFAILEAMLCGKAVVASAVGGVPEQLDGCGITVEPRNAQELADAIVSLMSDPARCAELGRTARAVAAQEFTIHLSTETYRSSYRRLIEHSSSRVEEHIEEVPVLQAIAVGEAYPSYNAGGSTLNSLARQTTTSVVTHRTRRRFFVANDAIEWIPPDLTVINELASEVFKRDAYPIDDLEVTAVLESMGMTDQTAAQRYGAPDTFVLAEYVLKQLRTMQQPPSQLQEQPVPRASVKQILRDYAAGPLVMSSNLLLLTIINVYQWAGGWKGREVLALSLGMTAGMLFANGFVQAIMRRASLALNLGSPRATSRFLNGTLQIAITALVAIALLLLLMSDGMSDFTLQERLIFEGSFLALATLWLLASILTLAHAPGWLALGLSSGLLVGCVVYRVTASFFSMSLLASSMLGFTTAVGIILYRVRKVLAVAPSSEKSGRVFLPSISYLVVEALPYFLYGALYMIFILTPHLLGWLGALNRDETHSFALISFEAGLTLSLPAMVLMNGGAEHTLRLFWQRVLTLQRTTSGYAMKHFSQAITAFYWWRLRRYLLGLAVLSAVFFGLFALIITTGVLSRWLGLVSLDTLVEIFAAGLLTYFLLGWGWFNCMFSITFGRPRLALQSVAIGIAVTVLFGVPLSLGVHFSYAAFTFVIGALAFAATSTYFISRLLHIADYHYYAVG